jgi:DNA-binding NarL/FixJ family response regulator
MPISVSIIEDEDLTREHLACLVSSSNLCRLAGSASSGKAARELIEQNISDVYLVDLGLPDVDGIELISLIKVSCREAQIMVLSTLGDARHIDRSIRAGATGYLLKDRAYSDLVEQIVRLHNGECLVSPSLIKNIFKSLASSSASGHNLSDHGFQKFLLSPRETAVMRMLVGGLPVVAIADSLNVSSHTINQHLRSIYRKLEVHSRSRAVAVAVQNGFLES